MKFYRILFTTVCLLFCFSIFSQPLILRSKEIGDGGDPTGECAECKIVELSFYTTSALNSQQLNEVNINSTVPLHPVSDSQFSLANTYYENDCTIYEYKMKITICFPCLPCSETTGTASFELTFTEPNSIDDSYLDFTCFTGTEHDEVQNEAAISDKSTRFEHMQFINICCGEGCDEDHAPTSDGGGQNQGKVIFDNDEVLNPYLFELNGGRDELKRSHFRSLQKPTQLVFPNPFSDQLFITDNKSFVSYEIYDLNGKVVARNDSGETITSYISTSQLLSGSFIIRLKDESGEIHLAKIFKL